MRGRALAGAGVAGALVVGTLALIVVITGTDPEPSSARRPAWAPATVPSRSASCA